MVLSILYGSVSVSHWIRDGIKTYGRCDIEGKPEANAYFISLKIDLAFKHKLNYSITKLSY